jgi:spore coat polysaccharide biosynthesis protein SpsF
MEHTLNATAIIQARMSSTRLPGKVLADVCGQPLLKRLVDRVRSTPGIDRVVVATTTESTDDVLAVWCAAHSVPVYRGSTYDVLDRIWRCAQEHRAEFIVRVTADDPLKDPAIIAKAIDLCASSNDIDYVSNTLQPSYPEGLDIEVLRYRTLDRAAREATLPSEREHVTPYIWKHPERFTLLGFEMKPNLSNWRWTVDKPADLELMRHIFSHFDDQPLISYRAVIAWLRKHPELLSINAGTTRNEGYLKTLAEEQKQ